MNAFLAISSFTIPLNQGYSIEVVLLLKSIKSVKKIFLVDSQTNVNKKIKKVPDGKSFNYAKAIKKIVFKNNFI